jgi:hypothetical protein
MGKTKEPKSVRILKEDKELKKAIKGKKYTNKLKQ